MSWKIIFTSIGISARLKAEGFCKKCLKSSKDALSHLMNINQEIQKQIDSHTRIQRDTTETACR